MKLYGTTTSPFVRRVRVVATEVGQAFDLINTAHDAGTAALKAVSPIWKVPVVEVGGRVPVSYTHLTLPTKRIV